jgi:hypothetical protein
VQHLFEIMVFLALVSHLFLTVLLLLGLVIRVDVVDEVAEVVS